MNALGKLLAILNVAAALATVAWAASVYGNPAPGADRTTDAGTADGRLTRMRAEIDRLARASPDAQAGHGARAAALARAEKDRGDRKRRLDARLAEARRGPFRAEWPVGNNMAFVNAGRVGPALVGPDGRPLRGADAQAAEYRRLVAEAEAAGLGIGDLRRRHGLLSDRVRVADDALARQRQLLAGLRAEAEYLAGERVNWAARLEVLHFRQRQLESLLKAAQGGAGAGRGGKRRPSRGSPAGHGDCATARPSGEENVYDPVDRQVPQ